PAGNPRRISRCAPDVLFRRHFVPANRRGAGNPDRHRDEPTVAGQEAFAAAADAGMRSAKCGMRSRGQAYDRPFFNSHSEFRTPHLVMSEKPTIREQIDACRGGSADLSLAELAPLAREIESNPVVAQELSRSQRFDGLVTEALNDLQVPA